VWVPETNDILQAEGALWREVQSSLKNAQSTGSRWERHVLQNIKRRWWQYRRQYIGYEIDSHKFVNCKLFMPTHPAIPADDRWKNVVVGYIDETMYEYLNLTYDVSNGIVRGL
jgi:hypothetical protein